MLGGLKVGQVELGWMVRCCCHRGNGVPNLDHHHQAPSYSGHLKYQCRESFTVLKQRGIH